MDWGEVDDLTFWDSSKSKVPRVRTTGDSQRSYLSSNQSSLQILSFLSGFPFSSTIPEVTHQPASSRAEVIGKLVHFSWTSDLARNVVDRNTITESIRRNDNWVMLWSWNSHELWLSPAHGKGCGYQTMLKKSNCWEWIRTFYDKVNVSKILPGLNGENCPV